MNLEEFSFLFETMHKVRNDVCYEIQISKSFIDTHETAGFNTGSCAHKGWTVKGESYTKRIFTVTEWHHAGFMILLIWDKLFLNILNDQANNIFIIYTYSVYLLYYIILYYSIKV